MASHGRSLAPPHVTRLARLWSAATCGVVAAAASLVAASTAADAATSGGSYVALSPYSLADSRIGTGFGVTGPLSAGVAYPVQVTTTRAGRVPTTGVTAVVLTVSVVNPSADGKLTVYPDGAARPNVANLLLNPSTNASNTVVVPLSSAGKVAIYLTTASDVLVDVDGYYATAGSSTGGTLYYPTTPTVLDSYDATAGTTRTTQVAGAGTVPLDATSVVLGVSATNPTRDGPLVSWPGGAPMPGSETLFLEAGIDATNLAMLPLDNSGAVKTWIRSGAARVSLSVVGYYKTVTTEGSTTIVFPTPVMVLDTTSGIQVPVARFVGPRHGDFNVAGLGPIPATAEIAMLNVSIRNVTADGSFSAYPAGQSQPTTGSIPYNAGIRSSTLLLVPLGQGGAVSFGMDTGSADISISVVGFTVGTSYPFDAQSSNVPTLSAPQLNGSQLDGATGVTYISSTAPTFTATPSDTDSAHAAVDFEIWADRDGQLAPVAAGESSVVLAASSATWTVTSDSALSPGWQYKWHARATDGVNTSAWSAWQAFSVVAAPETVPGPPSGVGADALTSGGASTMSLLRPTFFLTLPDGNGDLRAVFELSDAGTGVSLGTGMSEYASAGTRAEWQVPAGVLQNGRSATVRARVFDGLHYSVWSAALSFGVQAASNQAPQAPTSLSAEPDPAAAAPSAPAYLLGIGAVDLDRDDLTVDFEVSAAATNAVLFTTSEPATKGPVGETDTAAALIPDGVLTLGGAYTFRARSHDPTSVSPWSSSLAFTAAAPPPPEQAQASLTRIGSLPDSVPGDSCGLYSYLHSGTCSASGVERHPVTTPHGWHLWGHYGDNCTWSPDYPLGMNFVPACQVHDYGYALARYRIVSATSANKAYVDSDFYSNLRIGTCPHYWWIYAACTGLAYRYYLAVQAYGRFGS